MNEFSKNITGKNLFLQARNAIDSFFYRWGITASNHPWKVIVASMAATFILASFLSDLKIDTSIEAFFKTDDPNKVIYDNFRKQYGRDDTVVVVIEAEENVFEHEFLMRLSKLHHAIETEVPHVAKATSLINARHTYGNEDGLVVGRFLEIIPGDIASLQQLKLTAINNPLYEKNYITTNGKMAAIVVEHDSYQQQADGDLSALLDEGFGDSLASTDESSEAPSESKRIYTPLSEEENNAIMRAYDKIQSEFNGSGFVVTQTGGPYTTAWFLNTVKENMGRYTILSMLFVTVALFLIYRKWIMIIIPLSVSMLAVISTMSATTALGYGLSFSMQILPSFILAIGTANCVHVFSAFFQCYDSGETKSEAIGEALGRAGFSILASAITTAASLMSFLVSDMKSVVEFGVAAPLGALFALLYALILLPAVMAVFPIKTKKTTKEKNKILSNAVVACGKIAYTFPVSVISFWLFILAISAVGITKIHFSFDMFENLPQGHALLDATRKMDHNFAGGGPLELVVDSGTAGGVKDPAFLKKLQVISDASEKYGFQKAISILNVTKELHQALNENNPEYYAIPNDKNTIAQELLLFENSGAEDLEKLVDSSFRYARLTMIAPVEDGFVVAPKLKAFKQEIHTILGDTHSSTATGLYALTSNIFENTQRTMASSYLVSYLLIIPMMILMVGSIRFGLIAMIPNVTPIIITLGMMGFMGIDLTSATLLMGGIAIGLVVDDTIHFMNSFTKYFQQGNSVSNAIKNTLATSGKAIATTSIVLAGAFFIFMQNEVLEWSDFGFITGACIIFALLADLFLAPAVLTIYCRWKYSLRK